MADERTYLAGVTCWIDTEQPDVDAARHFYASLFGWSFSNAVPSGVPGTYLIASLEGADVAAIGPAAGRCTGRMEHLHRGRRRRCRGGRRACRRGQCQRGTGGREPGGRVAACADPRSAIPAAAATTAAGRPAHERAR